MDAGLFPRPGALLIGGRTAKVTDSGLGLGIGDWRFELRRQCPQCGKSFGKAGIPPPSVFPRKRIAVRNISELTKVGSTTLSSSGGVWSVMTAGLEHAGSWVGLAACVSSATAKGRFIPTPAWQRVTHLLPIGSSSCPPSVRRAARHGALLARFAA